MTVEPADPNAALIRSTRAGQPSSLRVEMIPVREDGSVHQGDPVTFVVGGEQLAVDAAWVLYHQLGMMLAEADDAGSDLDPLLGGSWYLLDEAPAL